MTDTGTQMPEPVRWLEEHGDAMYAYCLLRVRESGTAEKLVAEALVSAVTAVKTFKGESSERSWLLGILKRKILGHLRGVAKGKPLDAGRNPDEYTSRYFDESDHWQVPINEWKDTKEALERERFRTVFRDCVERLPERLRILYALKELDGLESEELLDALNIETEDNLRLMLFRAQVHLHQCLQTNWFKT